MFCFVCLFVFSSPNACPKPTQKPLPIFNQKKKNKRKKERKHQKERQKQRNITITRQRNKEYKQMWVKCTKHSSYENKIWTTILRIPRFLASNVMLWELHCGVTALLRSRTVTVELECKSSHMETSVSRYVNLLFWTGWMILIWQVSHTVMLTWW